MFEKDNLKTVFNISSVPWIKQWSCVFT